MREVFDRLKQTNIRLKINKCTFYSNTVKYLDHVVSDKKVSSDSKKIEWMVGMAVPTTVTEVKSFLGLTGYYQRFIHHQVFSLLYVEQLVTVSNGLKWYFNILTCNIHT